MHPCDPGGGSLDTPGLHVPRHLGPLVPAVAEAIGDLAAVWGPGRGGCDLHAAVLCLALVLVPFVLHRRLWGLRWESDDITVSKDRVLAVGQASVRLCLGYPSSALI